MPATFSLPTFDSIEIGDSLPAFEMAPISRLSLALYCGASGDHNPIHVDSDFVKSAGMPDVIAHGMLSMAWLGRLLTNWVDQPAIRELSVRFISITHVGERITCAGKVVEKFRQDGQACVRIDVTTVNQGGQVKLAGQALVVLA